MVPRVARGLRLGSAPPRSLSTILPHTLGSIRDSDLSGRRPCVAAEGPELTL